MGNPGRQHSNKSSGPKCHRAQVEKLRESVASASPDIHIFQGEEAASKKQSGPRPDSPSVSSTVAPESHLMSLCLQVVCKPGVISA